MNNCIPFPPRTPIPYDSMYHCLFNAITDALRLMDPESPAALLLMQAQQRTEEMYLSCGPSES